MNSDSNFLTKKYQGQLFQVKHTHYKLRPRCYYVFISARCEKLEWDYATTVVTLFDVEKMKVITIFLTSGYNGSEDELLLYLNPVSE